jgi:indoleamine 2,3-dioxygenase
MEYALSYALYNYYRIDPSKNYDAENIKLIREFEGSKSETGFVAVHVAMV